MAFSSNTWPKFRKASCHAFACISTESINVPSISKITALTIAPTPSARVNPWRGAVFQAGTNKPRKLPQQFLWRNNEANGAVEFDRILSHPSLQAGRQRAKIQNYEPKKTF